MQNHLEDHKFDHKERVARAERERVAKQLRKENKQPNETLFKLGEMLVEAGEALQQQAQPAPQRQRKRA